MRLNQPYNNKISVRLSDKQFDYISYLSDMIGISPSDVIRMILDSYIVRTERNENEKTS